MSDAFDLERITRTLELALEHHCPEVLAAQREDLLQKALMRVTHLKRAADRGRSLPASYLWRVAYCVVIDQLRYKNRRPEASLEAVSALAEHRSRELSPELQARGREVGRAIVEGLETLIPPRRVAVLLHLQGHSSPEIGELLGNEPKAIENLIYRGIRDLRDHLRRKGVEPS